MNTQTIAVIHTVYEDAPQTVAMVEVPKDVTVQIQDDLGSSCPSDELKYRQVKDPKIHLLHKLWHDVLGYSRTFNSSFLQTIMVMYVKLLG